MLENTDMAFLTLDDEHQLWGEQSVEDVIARARDAGVKEVVIKRGAESCLIAFEDQPLAEVPSVALPKKRLSIPRPPGIHSVRATWPGDLSARRQKKRHGAVISPPAQ